MKINPSIFKAYDIRGIYPQELNEETAFNIGQAFVEHTKTKKIAAGRDMRLSSPVLFRALAEGIISKGADVYDLGQIPTELIYFAVGKLGYGAAIMITASHNSKEYNGFKMIKKNEKGIEMVRGKLLEEVINKGDFLSVQNLKKGKILEKDIWEDYIRHIFSFVDVSKIKPFHVVIDAGNGMAGKVMPMLAPKLPVKIIPLNFELDGNFPAHPSDPLKENSANQIKKEVVGNKADFGFIFDGDADRIYLIDELGNFIQADITLLLLAKHLLKNNPGAAIAYNLICSKAVPEFIKKWGGNPIRTKVGFVNVMEEMKENNGIMGGELSGHYCFRDNFYSDSGFITFLILLSIISQSGKKVSELATELFLYVKAPEINFEIKNKEEALNEIKKRYSDGKQDYLDGVTVEYDDWWFNLRSSQTEPLLRLTIEAKTQELLEEKKKELQFFMFKTRR